MSVMPVHFGRGLGNILHRLCGARIDQRHGLRAFDRRGENEHRSDGREAENFHGLHFL